MKYQIIDAGYKIGKDKNILFAFNQKREVSKVADESGAGVSVVKLDDRLKTQLDT